MLNLLQEQDLQLHSWPALRRDRFGAEQEVQVPGARRKPVRRLRCHGNGGRHHCQIPILSP